MSEWRKSFSWWSGQRRAAHTVFLTTQPADQCTWALQQTRQEKGRRYSKSGKIGDVQWKSRVRETVCRVTETVEDKTLANQGATGMDSGAKTPRRQLELSNGPTLTELCTASSGTAKQKTLKLPFLLSSLRFVTSTQKPIFPHTCRQNS